MRYICFVYYFSTCRCHVSVVSPQGQIYMGGPLPHKNSTYDPHEPSDLEVKVEMSLIFLLNFEQI